ncbi:amidase family protein [Burkholderia pseudomallei]|uniref:amidase family protein n=1 Tax=Burkholderia pseudomallei TaxID=28450 RepID=UPI001E3358DE|nr:amidase family protein [Burkholderia pseudomallei]
MLARIAQLDVHLNAYIRVTAESALADARCAEQEIARGIDRGPLHGVPVAVRDIFNTKGRVILQACTLCASRIIGAKRCRFAAHSF